jgi:hypothetical protein
MGIMFKPKLLSLIFLFLLAASHSIHGIGVSKNVSKRFGKKKEKIKFEKSISEFRSLYSREFKYSPFPVSINNLTEIKTLSV